METITVAGLKSMISNFERLRSLASYFMQEAEKERDGIRESEISLSLYDGVVWTQEVNTACHCHPEMRTVVKARPLQEFIEWLGKQKYDLDFTTEKDWQ